MLFSSVCILCVDIENEILKDFNNKTTNESKYENDYSIDNDEEVEEETKQTFIEKLQQLHDEGKNLPISKNVNHINDTFNTLTNLRKVINFLFPPNKRTEVEVLEFISGIDNGLSHECLRSVLKVVSSIKNEDLWALKCKT